MHDTAIQNGTRFFDTYVSRMGSVTVLDIGAQNVNGSLKDLCPNNAKYVGLDFIAGKDVDIVLEDPYSLPVEQELADVVVSSSCFEHSEMFWLLYLEIMRVLKPSGLFYLNVPSNGPYHRFPVDCWRFYPDSGAALVRWGRRNGVHGALLESYICNQYMESWNDVVCVFVKDETQANRYPARILDTFTKFANGTVRMPDGQMQARNPRTRSQDQSYRGWMLHKRLEQLRLHLTPK
ncbi:MAG TPA: methyltransferase domain-containing protein [Steroidobacteraceae bacterium]|nr:methyltransferase domain-containing protein [Steroidobacteraceae bacterium]